MCTITLYYENRDSGISLLPAQVVFFKNEMDTTNHRPRSGGGIVVFGGGTATNRLVDVFESLRESRNSSLKYVIPISDNGGSSSELIRVFGGPGMNDIHVSYVWCISESSTDIE